MLLTICLLDICQKKCMGSRPGHSQLNPRDQEIGGSDRRI